MKPGRSLPFSISIVIVLLLAACAPAPVPTSASPAIEIKTINESQPVTVPLVQTKDYNQCDAATPLRTQIQFSESTVLAEESELTLGAKVGGEASVSAVAKVELEGSIQQKFASVNTSSKGYQEVVDIEVPAHAHYRYTITWQETRQEGVIEYTENGETKYADYSYRVGLALVSYDTENVHCPTPEVTQVPTILPQPSNTSPPPVKTLAEGCIFSRTWTVASPGTIPPTEADGCYAPELTGMFADPGGALRISDDNNRGYVTSGIYSPIRNDSTIEFKVYVNSMYIVDETFPAYVSFAVISLDDPLDPVNSARFKLHVERKENNPVIFFIAADRGENTGAKVRGRHYEYRHSYTVRFLLTGNVMHVYVNGIEIDESLELPAAGPKAFYIGYNLPSYGGVNAEIREVTVDGVRK